MTDFTTSDLVPATLTDNTVNCGNYKVFAIIKDGISSFQFYYGANISGSFTPGGTTATYSDATAEYGSIVKAAFDIQDIETASVGTVVRVTLYNDGSVIAAVAAINPSGLGNVDDSSLTPPAGVITYTCINGGNGGNGACFSYDTLHKLNVDNKILTKHLRGNKKMYRCKYGKLGILEITHDHAFIYKDKICSFEKLTEIHPIIKKNFELIPLDDSTCGKNSYIYNFIGNVNQYHKNNIIELDGNLKMVGGFTRKSFESYIDKIKKMHIMLNSASDMDTDKQELLINSIESNLQEFGFTICY